VQHKLQGRWVTTFTGYARHLHGLTVAGTRVRSVPAGCDRGAGIANACTIFWSMEHTVSFDDQKMVQAFAMPALPQE
jgi:hypothetical protein